MSFASEFNEIYSNMLKKYNYVYCSKLGCFAKMINSELLSVIYYTSKGCIVHKTGNKAFTVFGTVLSIYYPIIDKSQIAAISNRLYEYIPAKDYVGGIEYNDDNMTEVINKSFGMVEKYMLPTMEKVNDLNSFIDYLKLINIERLRYPNNYREDSLTLIVSENKDDFQSYIKGEIEKMPLEDRNEVFIQTLNESINVDIVIPRNEILATPELLQVAREEAQKRKEQNLKKIKTCKLI